MIQQVRKRAIMDISDRQGGSLGQHAAHQRRARRRPRRLSQRNGFLIFKDVDVDEDEDDDEEEEPEDHEQENQEHENSSLRPCNASR